MAPTASTVAGPTTDDWPSFADELSRKTSDQLQLWMDRYDRGVIGLATTLSVVSALYDATSGLVHRDLMDLIADVHKELLEASKPKS